VHLDKRRGISEFRSGIVSDRKSALVGPKQTPAGHRDWA
jgi:hypothetical protein